MVKGEKKIVMCKCAKKNVFQEMLRIEMEKREGTGVSFKLSDERLKQIGIEVEDE